MKIKAAFYFFLLLPCLVFSQDPYSIRYGIDEGLPTSNVYSAIEDLDGYMWFATDVGVLRFDGYSFKHYNTDDGLGDNEIFKIYQDSQLRIWFLSLNGKLSYYKNDSFFNGKNTAFLKAASYQKMIMDVYENTSGDLHFLFRDGHVSIIDANSNTSSVNQNNSGSFSIWESNNQPFILTKSVIRNIFTESKIDLPEEIISSNVYRATVNEDGDYFFSIQDKIFALENNSIKLVWNTNGNEIINLNVINGSFFISTRKGLIIKSKDKQLQYFENDVVSSVISDSQGNYWITTLNDGIKFIPEIELIRHRLSQPNLRTSAIQADENQDLWIGTQKGLLKMLWNKGGKSSLSRFPDVTNPIKKIKNYDNKIFIIGTESIQIFDKSKFTEYPLGALDILKHNEDYLLSSSIVFMVNSNELDRLGSFESKHFPKEFKDNIIMKRRTNSIAKSLDGHVYLGTSTGLYDYFNGEINKINSINEELNTSITDLFYDDEANRLLVASNSKGLAVIENNQIIHHITTSSGLNSNGCNTIKKFSSDSYFIGTNKGLNRLKLNNNDFKVRDFNKVLKN